MYVYTDNLYHGYHARVYNELGDTLFSVDNGGPEVVLNSPQMMYPIYNTPNGAKLIISFQYGPLNVYSLPGKLPVYCCDSLMSGIPNPMGFSSYNSMSMFPNPNNGSSTIEFQLPQGATTGEIVLYNMQGTEVKRYQVDNTFHNLLISNADLHSGTYLYQLHTSAGASGAKKMVLVK
ncbi:MAG: T9SS type A sorting domain-containing protein [Bacteroidota bacterium]